ncbi:hypothetical protein O181_047054 [Austropuccinia psidii MF-1]|uniref:Uncharacterized protein n=1 Tax=Austropuccinia psidii MF-1 TaxID=1389203 RepID=A0A9Q3HLR7_9BASI|nr:hypothetical protein [Austropuccinia psidii MF-1]
MIWVICKWSIHSGAEVAANYYWHPQIARLPHSFRCTPPWVICRQFSLTWWTFYHLSSKQQFLCAGGPLIHQCSPACACKPEAHQRRLSKASNPLKYSVPMIPDTGFLHAGNRHRRSYAGNLHMHCVNFGTCLPANSHKFPPGIPVSVSPQESSHTTKLMFGGMPEYIPHLPTQKDPHSEIFLSTATIAQ